jgi:hypothetical protein
VGFDLTGREQGCEPGKMRCIEPEAPDGFDEGKGRACRVRGSGTAEVTDCRGELG